MAGEHILYSSFIFLPLGSMSLSIFASWVFTRLRFIPLFSLYSNLVTQAAGDSIGFAVLWPFVPPLEIGWFYPAMAPDSVTLISFHDMPCELPSWNRKGSWLTSIWTGAIRSQVPVGLRWCWIFLKSSRTHIGPQRDLPFKPSGDWPTRDPETEFAPEEYNSHYRPFLQSLFRQNT